MATRAGDFVRAIFREDWDQAETMMAEMERHNENPAAITGFAFSQAVKRRFEPANNMGDIIHFVADARADLLAGQELPPRDAEALVCAVLGMDEPWVRQIVETLDVDTLVKIETQLLYKLATEQPLSDGELDRFIAEAERSVADWSPAN